MNEFLAELYGTRETIGASDSSDVEKLAEAQILDSVLQSEGINVDDLDDGTILKLAYEIFGDDSQLVKMAAEGEEEEKKEDEGEEEEEEEESAEEKTAEADLLGRIMAHSMVQELGNIEMQKMARVVNPDTGVKAVKAAISGAGKGMSGGKSMGGLEGKVRELLWKAKAPGRTYSFARKAKFEGGKSERMGRLRAGLAAARSHKPHTAVAAGGLGLAGGGAAYGAHKLKGGKKKEGSALNKLAEQRALEILAENGYEFDDGQDKLASAVEQRAWEMLAEAGYLE